MNPRSAEILEAAIREFIRSGVPVSSGSLYERYGFGIKPAMIRHELLDLTEEGFLEQPHHSAGRVPSDRGYEFFARRMVEKAEADTKMGELEDLFLAREWNELLYEFSKTMGLVGVVAEEGLRNIHRDGLEYLFDRLEVESRSELAEVVRDVEEIGERLLKAGNIFDHEDFLDVFVGKGPLAKSDCLSILASDYDVGGQRVLFFAIGPKRMDYEKAAKALKGLKKRKEGI